MSLGYHRMKMRVTTVVVDHMRSFSDGCNIVFNTFARPVRKIASRINAEAPWVVGVASCTLITIVPLVTYPFFKKYVMYDKRAAAEEERVRLCLQKGIDPYPYMRHKEFVYGNAVPALSKEEQWPQKIGWEYDAMDEYRRRKEELRQEVGGDVEDTVQKLMELRRKQAGNFRATVREELQEPADLIFHGRKDVDQLNS